MARPNAARLARRLILIGLLTAAAWILGRAPLPVVRASSAAQPERQGQFVGEGANRAALVVRYEDGSVQTRCVAFSEAEIRGDELLERSGLAPVISSEGTVCSIGGLGCASDDCFCRCPFPECEYWAYYHWRDGAWSYSSIGAASHRVNDGALEGWSWGQGNFRQGVEPPVVPFEQICQAAADGISALPPAATEKPIPLASMPAALSSDASAHRDSGGPAAVSDAARQLAESRSFSPSLLPGYAAYMLALTTLIVIGWYVLHRKNGQRAAHVRESAPDDRWLTHEVHGRGRE
jgi:hypothetical protein